MDEIGHFKYCRRMPHFKKSYADINALLTTVEPILHEHGLLLLQPVVGNEGGWYQTNKVRFRSGLPEKIGGWNKEVNKGYTAFLNGVSTKEMHPHIYDRLMVDGKIQLNAYLKYYKDKVDEAKQMILHDYFQEQKKKGFTYIYFIKNEK